MFATGPITFRDPHTDMLQEFTAKYNYHVPLVHTFIGQNERKHTIHQGTIYMVYRSEQINKDV